MAAPPASVILLVTTGALAAGCATMEVVDRALHEVTEDVAPASPVTGSPVLNVVSEEREIEMAQQLWAKLADAAAREGVAVNPPGERLGQVRRVFDRLVGVAHRQHLRWAGRRIRF